MAEEFAIAIITQIGKEAYRKWRKRVKSMKLKPKKMLEKIFEADGYAKLYYVVHEAFNPSQDRIMESKTEEQLDALEKYVEDRGGLEGFSAQELIEITLKSLKLYKKDQGESYTIRMFCYHVLRSYFIDTVYHPTFSAFRAFKMKQLNSIHLTRNFGFVEEGEFMGVLEAICDIDLIIKEEEATGVYPSWVEIKDRLLFLCFLNDTKPENFSLLK